MKLIKILAVILVLMLALSLSACATTEESAELTPLTLVLDWIPNINHTGIYVAEAEGYFAEQGLDVEIIQPGNNWALQLVASGQAQFGISYQEEVTFARMEGVPVTSLAAVIQHNTSAFASPADRNILSPADFPNTSYGGWGGAVEEALIGYLLAEQNAPDTVEMLNLGETDFFSAWDSGDVDFSWIYYGVTGVEAELRDYPLNTIMIKDIAPEFDYYTPVIVAEDTWISDNPELASKMMNALSKGYQFADQNPAEAAQILLDAEEGLDADLVKAGQEWMAGKYQGDAEYWGYQSLDTWQNFADWLVDNGLLAEGFVAEDAFMNDYIKL